VPEAFAALLEDDNWWEPAFLATMVAALQSRPEAVMAWANMRLWQEEPGGGWTDTGRNIWPRIGPGLVRSFHWPVLLQGFDTLHSNGAMVYRGGKLTGCVVPAATPMVIMERAREFAMPDPWLLVTTPLANFAMTQTTSRGVNRTEWAQSQLLVSASFFHQVRLSPAAARSLWRKLGAARPRSTVILFLLTLSGACPPSFLRHATGGDWLYFLANFFRHPVIQLRALRFRSAYPTVWRYLLEHTRARRNQRPPGERGPLDASSLLDKGDLTA
jgi:hypothetical protein